MNILVTGASGFLGGKTLEGLISADPKNQIFLLLRGRSFESLSQKYAKITNVACVKGDLTNPDIFDDQEDFRSLKKKITHIIHLGALYDIEASEASLIKVNTIGTQNLLFFANYCEQLESFLYASTIAVSGNHNGPFGEDDFKLGQEFGDYYAYSKYKAEDVVRNWALKNPGIRVDVFRFGIIVGDAVTGEFEKVDGIYYFLKTIVDFENYTSFSLKSPFYPFPFSGHMPLPIVSVDFAKDVILKALEQKKKGIFTYHVLNDDLPTLSEFLEDFFEALGHKTQFKSIPRNFLLDKTLRNGLPILGLPAQLIDYMYINTNFIKVNCTKYLEIKVPSYQDMKKTLFEKAIERFKKEDPSIGPKTIETINSIAQFVRRHL